VLGSLPPPGSRPAVHTSGQPLVPHLPISSPPLPQSPSSCPPMPRCPQDARLHNPSGISISTGSCPPDGRHYASTTLSRVLHPPNLSLPLSFSPLSMLTRAAVEHSMGRQCRSDDPPSAAEGVLLWGGAWGGGREGVDIEAAAAAAVTRASKHVLGGAQSRMRRAQALTLYRAPSGAVPKAVAPSLQQYQVHIRQRPAVTAGLPGASL